MAISKISLELSAVYRIEPSQSGICGLAYQGDLRRLMVDRRYSPISRNRRIK